MENTNTSGGYSIHGAPKFNAITKEEFLERVEKVFDILGNILSKSFGAYGATTFIANLAKSTVTKDGYTIARNLVADVKEGDPIDQAIFNIALAICARLNYKVGDGTTTAIVCTNKTYEAYREGDIEKKIQELGVLPRDVMKRMVELSKELIERIKTVAEPIRGEENASDLIREIVEISSNGDKKITDMITEAYSKLKEPSISCEMSKDMRTRMTFVEGYKMDLALTDECYINTDGKMCIEENVDVLLFDHKISSVTYENIIHPVWGMCTQMGRKLVVIAPFYDQTTLYGTIKRDIYLKYEETKDNSLILLVATAATEYTKKMLGDLAILLNTELIDKFMVESILDLLQEYQPHQVLDISNRHIPGINIAEAVIETMPNGAEGKVLEVKIDDGKTEYNTEVVEKALRVGFAGVMKATVRDTTFSGFYYEKELYQKVCDEAYNELTDFTEQYAKLGTHSAQVARAQQRYNRLQLEMALIEVGGDSDLSQNMLKDSVDDSVRAAASAMDHGYVMGGNLTTMLELKKMWFDSKRSELDKILLKMLFEGFWGVYQQILENAYGERTISIKVSDAIDFSISDSELASQITEQMEKVIGVKNVFYSPYFESLLITLVNRKECVKKAEEFRQAGGDINDLKVKVKVSYALVSYSMRVGKVFDLSKKEFSDKIINSAQTDVEVITAVMDLMNLLINGNQMVLTSKNNFVNV